VVCVLVVTAVSIVSLPLPDFLKNILPSGILMAIWPTPSELVVGTDPADKLLKCMILSGIVYKYSSNGLYVDYFIFL